MDKFQTIGAALAFALLLFQFLRVLPDTWRWPTRKLWPNRKDWGAECIPPDSQQEHYDDDRLNPNRAWKGSPAERWSQLREMRKGDYFQLHIRKPRVISRIEAVSEGHRYPKRYKLLIKHNDVADWEEVNEYDDYIDVALDKPTKLIGIKLEVVEPRLEPKDFRGRPPAWSIYDIRLTEVRLLEKFWRRVIK